MLSGNCFSISSTSLRLLDDNRSNMLSMMPGKALGLMNLPSLLYHVVWLTRPFSGMRAPINCPSRDFGRISQEFGRVGGLPLRVFQNISHCVDGSVEPLLLACRRLIINASIKDTSLIFVQ